MDMLSGAMLAKPLDMTYSSRLRLPAGPLEENSGVNVRHATECFLCSMKALNQTCSWSLVCQLSTSHLHAVHSVLL